MAEVIIYCAFFALSFLSGMLGVGVGFALVPLLEASGVCLIHGAQPMALFLNGIMAFFAALSFVRAGMVSWRNAIHLTMVTSTFAPVGALAAASVIENRIWGISSASVGVAVFILLAQYLGQRRTPAFNKLILVAIPAAWVSGLLGVGPGLLLVPLMIFLGFKPRYAAAMNAVAAVPASFLSLIPYPGHFSIHSSILPMVVIAAVGAMLGARFCGLHAPEWALRRLFVVLVLGMSLYRSLSFGGTQFQNAVELQSTFPHALEWTET